MSCIEEKGVEAGGEIRRRCGGWRRDRRRFRV